MASSGYPVTRTAVPCEPRSASATVTWFRSERRREPDPDRGTDGGLQPGQRLGRAVEGRTDLRLLRGHHAADDLGRAPGGGADAVSPRPEPDRTVRLAAEPCGRRE